MKRILVADDEQDCCDSLKKYFVKRDYDVDVAYDGLKAKELLEAYHYDYILFDCNMPELTGIELVKVINEKNPKAFKIMISGYEVINEDFANDLGIDHFLNKPISLEDVERIMKDG